MSDSRQQTELATGENPEQPKQDYSERERQRLLLQDFQRRLNAEPDPREFDETPDGKAFTLPISFVEMTLDEMYLGLWETYDYRYIQIFNEVVGSIVLEVTHPVTGRPIRRTGGASVVITQDAKAKVHEFNQTKKMNALDLAFPKLKAECVKNAAQSLGKIFGRDINRRKKDVFKPPLKPIPDDALLAAIKRVEGGQLETIALLEAHFILSEEQKAMINGAKPETKLLN